MSEQSFGEFNGHEIYPMPMFAKLAVADIVAVAAWYEQALGFANVFSGPMVNGKPMIVHLRRHKYQDLLLTGATSEASASNNLSLNFSADGEVDSIAERARSTSAVGASSVGEPVDTPWNTRDVNVTDPAGNKLIFTGRQANPDPEQAARWKAIFDQQQQKSIPPGD